MVHIKECFSVCLMAHHSLYVTISVSPCQSASLWKNYGMLLSVRLSMLSELFSFHYNSSIFHYPASLYSLNICMCSHLDPALGKRWMGSWLRYVWAAGSYSGRCPVCAPVIWKLHSEEKTASGLIWPVHMRQNPSSQFVLCHTIMIVETEFCLMICLELWHCYAYFKKSKAFNRFLYSVFVKTSVRMLMTSVRMFYSIFCGNLGYYCRFIV